MAALLGALALSACVHSRLHEEQAWTEVRTEHLLVNTDLDAETAASLVGQLERVTLGLLQRWWPGADVPERPLHIVLLANEGEFREFADSGVTGYYTQGTGLGGGLVVTSAGESRFALRMNAQLALKHELTHHLLNSVMRQAPIWVSEGLATYMEGLEVEEARDVLIIGKPSEMRMRELAAGDRTWTGDWDIAEWRRSDVNGVLNARRNSYDLFENRAWQMFFGLANAHPELLDNYLRLLWTGTPNEEAMKEAFRDLPSDVLAKELTARFKVRSVEYSFSELPLPPLTKRAATRKLSTAEMHAQLAEVELSGWRFRARERAEREARRALAAEPINLRALSVLSILGFHDNGLVKACRRAVQADPSEVFALRLLSKVLEGPEHARERRELLSAAMRAAPEDPDVLSDLAWEDIKGGNGRLSLSVAQKAADLAPDRAEIIDTLAAAFAQAGRCAEALEAQLLAVKLAGGRSERLQKRLAAYQAGCKTVPLE
jgi:hypothetical protein